MDLRLLLAICCFLTVVQARPRSAEPDACSQNCKGRQFWTGYEVGKTYKYSFQHEVSVASGGASSKASALQATGFANVEVHGPCEMVLKVELTGSKVSKSADEANVMQDKTLPADLQAALRQPLRFAFEDGRIPQLCPTTDDTRASLNVKRAILSQLQVSVESKMQQGMINERDVLGDCWTKYAKMSDSDTTIEKTKDLASCTGSHEAFPSRGVKVLDRPNLVPGMEGQATCRVDTSGKMVQKSTCTENRKLGRGSSKMTETVTSTTILELQGTISSLATSLAVVGLRSGLQHEHKDGSECQTSQMDEEIFQLGSECNERKQLAGGAKYKEQAQAAMNELCTMANGDKVDEKIAQKLADLIKYLRGISTASDLQSLIEGIQTGECKTNKLFKAIVYSALPSVGTKQSAKAILELFQMTRYEDFKSRWLYEGIAMMPNPSPEVIRVALDNVKAKINEDVASFSDALENSRLLSFSVLVGRYCSVDPACEAIEVVKEAIDFISGLIGPNCSNEKETFTYNGLVAIGNIGRVKGGVGTIMTCALNEDLPLSKRVFAIRALRKFPSLSLDEKNQLARIVLSNSYDSELRIVAYQILSRHADMSYRNSPTVAIQLSKLLMDKEQDLQVQMFVYSHLRSLMQIKGRSPFKGVIEKVVAQFERTAKRSNFFGLGYSKYMRMVYKLPAAQSQLDVESNVIYSSTSPIPRYLSANLTVDCPITGEAVSLFEMGVRAEGVEKFAAIVYNLIQKRSGSSGAQISRKRRQATLMDQHKNRAPKATEVPPRLDIFKSKYGMQYGYSSIGQSAFDFAQLALESTEGVPLKGSLSEIFKRLSPKSVRFGGAGLDSAIAIPTMTGFPVLLKIELYHVVDVPVETGFTDGVMSMSVKPFASAHLIRTLSIDGGFEKTGFRTTTNVLSSTGLRFSVVANTESATDFKLSFKVDSLTNKQQIIDVQTKAIFFRHGNDKQVKETPLISAENANPVQKRCSDPFFKKNLGREICIESSYAKDTKLIGNICRIPGEYRMYLAKSDSGSFETTLSFKRDSDEYADTKLELIVGDKTNAKRHLRLFYERDSEDSSRKIDFEFTHPLIQPIKFASEAKLSGYKKVDATLSIGQYYYILDGKRKNISETTKEIPYDVIVGDLKFEKRNAAGATVTSKQVQLTVGYRYKASADYILPTAGILVKLERSDYGLYQFRTGILNTESGIKWSMMSAMNPKGGSSYEVASRIEYFSKNTAAKKYRSSLVYDLKIKDQSNNQLNHNLQIKVDKTEKAENKFATNFEIKHDFTDSRKSSPSKLNCKVALTLEQTMLENALGATGSGEISVGPKFEKSIAKISDLVFYIGDGPDEIDSHPIVKKISLKYTLELMEKQSTYDFVTQILPYKNRSPTNQCLSFKLDVKDLGNSERPKEHLILLKNAIYTGDSSVPQIDQAFVLTINSRRLMNFKHSLKPVKDVPQSYQHRVEINEYTVTNTYTRSESKHELLTEFSFRTTKKFSLSQQLVYKAAEFSVPLEFTYSADITYKSFNAKVTFSETMSEQTGKNAFELINYSLSGDAIYTNSLRKFLKLISELKVTRKLEIEYAKAKVKLESEVDFAKSVGDIIIVTAHSNDIMVYKLTVNRQASGNSFEDLKRTYKFTVTNSRGSRSVEASLETKTDGTTSTSKHVIKYSKGEQLKYHLEIENEAIIDSTQKSLKSVLTSKKGSVLFENMEYSATAAFKMETTVPMQPTVNIDLILSAADDREASVKYTLDYTKVAVDSLGVSKVDSLLETSSNVPGLPLPKISSQVIYQSDDEVPFKWAFINQVNDKNFYTEKLEFTPSGMVFLVSANKIGELSYTSSYESKGDKSYKIRNDLKFKAKGEEIGYVDEGTFRMNPAGENTIFDVEYVGVTTFIGSETRLGSYLGMGILRSYGLEKIPMDSRMKIKSTGEFDVLMRFEKMQGDKKSPFLGVAAALNYWPLKLTAVVDMPFSLLAPIPIASNRVGIDVNAAGSASNLNSSLWVGDPFSAEGNTLTYQHTVADKKYESTLGLEAPILIHSQNYIELKSQYELTDEKSGKGTTTLAVKSKKRETLQSAVLSLDFGPKKFSLTFAPSTAYPSILITSSVTTVGDNDQANFKISAMISQEQFFNISGDYVYGSDYYAGVNLKSTFASIGYGIVLINSGTKYSFQDQLPVAGANLGLYMISPYAKFYFLRSGTSPAFTYYTKYVTRSGKEVVSTQVEVANGRVTSGSGTIDDKTVTFTSSESGVINVKVGSSDGTIEYSSTKGDDGYPNAIDIKATMKGKEKCIKFSRTPITVQFGDCANLATLKINYDIQDAASLLTFSGKFDLELVAPTGKDSVEIFSYTGSPVQLPVGTLSVEMVELGKLYLGQCSLSMGTWKYNSSYRQDFTNFPYSASVISKAEMGEQKYSVVAKYNFEEKFVVLNVIAKEEFKFSLNPSHLAFKLSYYEMLLSYLKDQTLGEVTEVKVLQLKLSGYPTAASSPLTIRLWKGKVSDGVRVAVVANIEAGEASISCDVADFEKTENFLKFKVRTAIRDTIKSFVRPIDGQTSFSFEKKPADGSYDMKYDEFVKYDGSFLYNMKSRFIGSGRSFPSVMSIEAVDGYVLGEFSYDFKAPSSAAANIRYKQTKFFSTRGEYLMEFILNAPQQLDNSYGRGFSAELSCPTNQMWVSRASEQQSEGSVKTVVEIFFDKRRKEGATVTLINSSPAANEMVRSMEIELPTRVVGFDRRLKYPEKKINYDLVIYWNKKVDMGQKFTTNYSLEYELGLVNELTAFDQQIRMSSPLLSGDIIKRLVYRTSDEGFSIVSSSSNRAVVVNATVDYRKYWDERREAYQKEFVFAFRESMQNLKADLKIMAESMHLRESRMFSPWKYLTTYNVYSSAEIPSKEVKVDRHYLVRSVPYEEFTVASKSGTSFSFRFFRGIRNSFVRFFVSDVGNAAKLVVKMNRQRPWWTMTLQRGSGSVDPKTKIGMPAFTSAATLVQASGGLSKSGMRISHGVFCGEMTEQYSGWKLSEVPANVNFMFMGLRVHKPNSVSYEADWRMRSGAKTPLRYIREEIVDRYRNSRRLPFDPKVIIDLISSTVKGQAVTVEVFNVLGLVQEFSSKDFDSMKKWYNGLQQRNPSLYALLRSLIAVSNAGYRVRRSAETPVPMFLGSRIRRMKLADFTPSGLISRGLRALESVQKMSCRYFIRLLNYIGRRLERESAVRRTARSIRIIEQSRRLSQEVQSVSDTIQDGLNDQLINQVAHVLQLTDGITGMLMDNAKSFGKYNKVVEKWRGLLRMVTRSNEQPSGVRDLSSKYSKSLSKAVGLMIAGRFRKAVRVFVTELHRLNQYRDCNQACMNGGSYGALNGTVYLPYYIDSFRRQRQQKFGSFIQNYNINPRDKMTPLLHRMHLNAQVSDREIKTFGGRRLTQMNSCKYLMAHDYKSKRLSVYQSYVISEGGLRRGSLLIHFGPFNVAISRSNEVTLNDSPMPVEPVAREQNGESEILARRQGSKLAVEFHGKLRNALIVRCDSDTSKCRFKVHPLFFNQVNGAFGSSDRNPRNDLFDQNESSHLRLWNAGNCMAS